MKRTLFEIAALVVIVAVFRHYVPAPGRATLVPTPERIPTVVTELRDVPVQYTTNGGDREYIHGRHCIDERSF